MKIETVALVLYVLACHWFADFVLQTHWQATNKSKDFNALGAHVATYTVVMMILLCRSVDNFLAFGGITFIAHFVTDAITSRVTGFLYKKQDFHNFFVVIGFDQLLHYTQLFLTIWWLQS